jgi:hypothetical protein
MVLGDLIAGTFAGFGICAVGEYSLYLLHVFMIVTFPCLFRSTYSLTHSSYTFIYTYVLLNT